MDEAPATFRVDEVRAAFPALLRCTYLNTAATGVAWPGQADAVAEFFREHQALGYEGSPLWRARAQACRAAVAGVLHVEESAVEFAHSTTEALNLIASSLPLRRGDRVAFAGDEFPSVMLPWQLRVRDGAELVRVTVDEEAGRTDALVTAVERGTRVLAVSHVHWRTGTRVDLERLHAACRRAGCWLIVDGAHALGAMPVCAALADAYCAPAFKWLLSGFGVAFLSLSAALAAALHPGVVGYANPPPSRALAYAHHNYPGLYALHATLAELGRLGWPAIHARVAALGTAMHDRLTACGFGVVTPADARAGIVAVRHPDSANVAHSLAARGIHVADRQGLLRAAPYFYNTIDEVDVFVRTLAELSA